jgi:hypothetical protein
MDGGDLQLDGLEMKMVQELEHQTSLGLLDCCWEETLTKKLLIDAGLIHPQTPTEEKIDGMKTINVDDDEIRWPWFGTGASVYFVRCMIELDT